LAALNLPNADGLRIEQSRNPSHSDLNRGRGSLQTETISAQSFPNLEVVSATLHERKFKI
jgi:hypothetical protein